MSDRHDPSAESPDLHAEVRLQQQIDASLRRVMRPPSPDRLRTIAEDAVRAVAPPSPRRRVTRRHFAVAAAVALGLVGTWQLWHALGPTPSPAPVYERQPWRSLQTVYRDWVAEGFKPAWVCRDEREFVESFRSVLGQGLALGELPADTIALGLAYCHSITPQTTCLLAEVGGRPVVVFVDRIERDTPQGDVEGLNLFRRRLGNLVLYELSPREQPAVLPWFVNPEDNP